MCYSYGPGDIALIFPDVASKDVDSLLECQKWEDSADEPMGIDIDKG